MLNITPFLKAYARRRWSKINSWDPAEVQQAQLNWLLSQVRRTQFGTDHNLTSVKTVEDWQKSVPLRRYEDFWDEYWKDAFPNVNNVTWPGLIDKYSLSSGTTSGTTKYIPYTKAMNLSNNKAGLDLLTYHCINKPDTQIFGGKSLVMGGSTNLREEANGIYSGDLSALANMTMPFWAKMRIFPNDDIADLSDWEIKMDKICKAIYYNGQIQKDIRTITGVPSWQLILFDLLLEHTGKERLTDIFPNLEMLVHGGIAFTSFKKRFEEIFADASVDFREVYPSSEGFIATADRGFGEGLRMTLDHHIFFEFVPVEELDNDQPTRHWIGNIETGVNYALVLNSCAGMWGYVIGDTVEFVDVETPRLKITGRTAHYLSSFGEHVITAEIDDALHTAGEKTGLQYLDYTVGSVFPEKKGDLGYHLYIVEFDEIPSEAQTREFAHALDQRLIERNEDYEAHRSGGFGMKDPVVKAVKTGTFRNWMKSRGKLGGQNKVPRVLNKPELFDSLMEFTD